MSWLSKQLGWDEKGEAISRMQEQQQQQQQYWQDQYGQFGGQMDETYGDLQQKLGTGAQGARTMMNQLRMDVGDQAGKSRRALGAHGEALSSRFSGLVGDVMQQGRRQAAASGLIGGGQEGGIVNPAIGRLGETFGSQMAQAQLGFEQSMLGTEMGLGQMGLGLEQDIMGLEAGLGGQYMGAKGGLAGGAQSQAGTAGGAAAAGQGYYSSPAGGFFDMLGDVGQFAGGLGSLFNPKKTENYYIQGGGSGEDLGLWG